MFVVSLFTYVITLQNGTRVAREDLLYKVVIFVFSAHKKYSRSFVKLWLNIQSLMLCITPGALGLKKNGRLI